MRQVALLVVGLVTAAPPASAFTLETAFSVGCHEQITLDAIKQSAWPKASAPPEVTHDDLVLARNLPFTVPPGTDRWSLAMVVGVRDNDLEGYSLTDLPELAAIHGAADQSSHCLRSADQDFDEGDTQALIACRAFIHREVELAVAQADEADLGAEEDVMVALPFQRRQLRLSRYAFHMGRAMHALQDSYAHTFRETESIMVVGVLNYIEAMLPNVLDIDRDGHAHLSDLDKCRGSDAATARAREATSASAALLEAAANAMSQADRRARVDAVIDRSLKYRNGCGSTNQWCGAFPALHVSSGEMPQGCSASGSWSLALVALVALRRSRR